MVRTVPSVKVDQSFGTKTKLSFYWSEWRQDRDKSGFDGLPFPISPARIFIDRTPTYRLNFDRTVTPTFLVHVGTGVELLVFRIKYEKDCSILVYNNVGIGNIPRA
jgi:hypothetical protein